MVLVLSNSTAEGKVWLEWEQAALKVKAISSAVEGGRIRLQVQEDIHTEGHLFLAHANVKEIVCYNGTR